MRILNLGSLNFDKVYDVPHFVRPGETILGLGYAEFLGGKGLNQSLALARAGAEVWHAGAVGPEGGPLRDCLAGAGVRTELLRTVDTVSGHAIIQKHCGQNCIIVFGGANQAISREQIDEALSRFAAGDLLLLQNETSNAAYAITRAHELGLRVAFNASPITPELMDYPLDLVDLFIINEVEGQALAGIESEDYARILEALTARYPRAEIVLTVGEHGVLCRCADGVMSYPARKVTVADTTAAGDTFCGYYLAALAQGLPLETRLRLATLASSIAVSRDGASTSIPTRDEVDALINP